MTFAVEIRQDWCKGCYLCVELCPRKVFGLTGVVARRGFRTVEIARPDRCNGCLVCELMCPDVAIRVTADEVAGNETDQVTP